MKTIIFALLAALCGPAFADGVNLTSLPAPALNALERQKLASIQLRQGGTLAGVFRFNAAALDSTVINVTMPDGSKVRIVGVKTADADAPNVDFWKGTGPSAKMMLTRYSGRVEGYFEVAGKRYLVLPLGTSSAATVLVDNDPVAD